jgi:hypothetical protein
MIFFGGAMRDVTFGFNAPTGLPARPSAKMGKDIVLSDEALSSFRCTKVILIEPMADWTSYRGLYKAVADYHASLPPLPFAHGLQGERMLEMARFIICHRLNGRGGIAR